MMKDIGNAMTAIPVMAAIEKERKMGKTVKITTDNKISIVDIPWTAEI